MSNSQQEIRSTLTHYDFEQKSLSERLSQLELSENCLLMMAERVKNQIQNTKAELEHIEKQKEVLRKRIRLESVAGDLA